MQVLCKLDHGTPLSIAVDATGCGVDAPRIYYDYTFADETPMAQAILKWGNSLAFRIPAAIAKQMEIDEGAEVEFRIDGKRLVIEKAGEVPKFTHQELVKALRKAKKSLIDFGSPRGKEML